MSFAEIFENSALKMKGCIANSRLSRGGGAASFNLFSARLAQLAEHYLDTVGVTSSSLVPRTSLRSKPTFGGSKRRMVSSVALAKEDSLVNSSELRMAGQLFQDGEQKFVAG